MQISGAYASGITEYLSWPQQRETWDEKSETEENCKVHKHVEIKQHIPKNQGIKEEMERKVKKYPELG